MEKILGLDLGTNSLGWALIEKDSKLIDGGVIIFPRGTNQDQVNGKEESYAQQRTGYRSARRRNYRRKMRIRRLRKILGEKWNSDLYKSGMHSTSPLDLYRLRYEGLDRLLDSVELSRIILYFAGKRGFKSSRKAEVREGDSKTETGKVKLGIAELRKTLEAGNFRTLGHFYYDLISAHFKGERLEERILERWTDTEMYREELEMILRTQMHLNSPLVDEELREIILREVFYQRKLKSCKHLVAKCRFEKNKRCMPKSHPLFQEFRLRQALNNLKWTDPDTGEQDNLTYDQREVAFKLYNSKLSVSATGLKKALGLSSRVVFNEIELKPASTMIRLMAILKDQFDSYSQLEVLDIYHSLLYTEDDQKAKFKEYLNRKFNIEGDTAEELWSMPMEADYASISHKAALKILKELKEGKEYSKACYDAGYHHSHEKIEVFKEKVEHPKTNEFKNPVVQKSVNVCISLVNKIIEKYGKPDIVRIELVRELKKPKIERQRIFNNNRNKEKKREKYREVLSRHLGYQIYSNDALLKKYELWLELGCSEDDLREFNGFADNIRAADLEKYKLWLESDRISPYSGKVISLERLMSPDIEIEHIIPFSRSLDDSFMNKTLCERHINKDKGEQTPIEFFKVKSDKEFDDFKKRMALFSNPAKAKVFLTEKLEDDFLSNQLTDSAYIATLAVSKLKECIPNVYTTKGGTTSFLRQAWGLNRLLYDDLDQEMKDLIKNRGDHRHHFIDAVVIASTTQRHVQSLAAATSGNDGRIRFTDIPLPWSSFRSDLEDKLNSILVVHRFKKRLVSRSINRYRDSKKGCMQKGISIRGSLHEDTLYGRIKDSRDSAEKYVVRKDVRSLDIKKLSKVVDEGIRSHLVKLADETPGGWAAVIKGPIYWQGRPLRKVRWLNASKDLPLLREETKTYVEPGNNYLLAIYQNNESGKRDYDSITYFEAVRRYLNREPVIKSRFNEMNLLFSVTSYDKFVLYDSHPDEIDWNEKERLQKKLYHVVKFTGNSIYLGKTNVSNIKADYDKPPLKVFCGSNTIRAIKIKLDLLGNIVSKQGV